MSPGQLSILAAMHHAANTGEAPPDDPTPMDRGTPADLVMLAGMTRG